MALIKNINGSGSQVGASSRQIATARQGVAPADKRVQMAEPATQFTAEQQKAMAGAAVAVQSRPAPANSTSPFKS
jgi:hypothetical protein